MDMLGTIGYLSPAGIGPADIECRPTNSRLE